MSKYSDPRRVVKTKGTAVLDNGQWWNGLKVARSRIPEPVSRPYELQNDVTPSSAKAHEGEVCGASIDSATVDDLSNVSLPGLATGPADTVQDRRTIVPP